MTEGLFYDEDEGDFITEEEVHERLLAHRGGCSCMHPPYAPPCSNCCTPWTLGELSEMGIRYMDTDIGEDAAAPQPDYSLITKQMCGG